LDRLRPARPSRVSRSTEFSFRSFLLLTVMLCLGVGIGIRVFRHSAPDAQNASSPQPYLAPARHSIKRINYPFSIIPYGVHVSEDLRRAMAGNAEIARHFQAFDFRHAKFVVLQKDSCAYVSFRKDGKIAWTQKCVTLHRGELILTDGFYMIRALCGNQVSFTPQAPSEPVDVTLLGPAELPVAPEPAPTEVLAENASQPTAVAEQPIGMPIGPPPALPPVTVAGGPPTFPVVIPPHSGGCCVTAKPHPPGSSHPPAPPTPPTPPRPPVPLPDGGYDAMFLLAAVVIALGFYAKNR
jgi:hypothetical protein